MNRRHANTDTRHSGSECGGEERPEARVWAATVRRYVRQSTRCLGLELPQLPLYQVAAGEGEHLVYPDRIVESLCGHADLLFSDL